jgi:PAS domain S-box-containing protein
MDTSEKRKKKPLNGPTESHKESGKPVVDSHKAGSRSQTTSSQEIYRAIFDKVNDAILLRDMETMKIVEVNKKLCEMTGYPVAEMKRLPRGWFSASPVQNGKTMDDYYEAARSSPQLFEWQCRRKDGTLFWEETNLTAVPIGNRHYILSVIRDVTLHRQHREEIRQSQERYRSIVEEQSVFMVCHLLADGTMTFVNEALCRCVGVAREELLGKPIWPFIAKEDVERLRIYLAEAGTHDPVATIEHRVVTRDGPRTLCGMERQGSP